MKEQISRHWDHDPRHFRFDRMSGLKPSDFNQGELLAACARFRGVALAVLIALVFVLALTGVDVMDEAIRPDVKVVQQR